jgi:hypothetical protein
VIRVGSIVLRAADLERQTAFALVTFRVNSRGDPCARGGPTVIT